MPNDEGPENPGAKVLKFFKAEGGAEELKKRESEEAALKEKTLKNLQELSNQTADAFSKIIEAIGGEAERAREFITKQYGWEDRYLFLLADVALDPYLLFSAGSEDNHPAHSPYFDVSGEIETAAFHIEEYAGAQLLRDSRPMVDILIAGLRTQALLHRVMIGTVPWSDIEHNFKTGLATLIRNTNVPIPDNMRFYLKDVQDFSGEQEGANNIDERIVLINLFQ